MSVSIPSLSLPELWEVIIGFVDKYTDLKAISLVCQCFTSPAQRGLFHDIKFSIASTTRAIRLDAILRDSPHLIPYVRKLVISSGNLRCYEILAGISWSNLRNLFLYDPLTGNGNRPDERVEHLVRIPSLRTLTIIAGQKTLRHIVSACSPGIDTVALHCLDHDESDSAALPLSCPRIRDFSLSWQGEVLPDFISDVLDLTTLEILRWELQTPSTLHRFFTEHGSRIRQIDMGIAFETELELWATFDIAVYFPCLKTLTIRAGISRHIVSMLKRMPLHNGVEELEFPWILHPSISDDDMREFETCVLQRLPALRRVKFVLDPLEWKEPQVRGKFPTQKTLLDERREAFPSLAREKNGGLIEVWIGKLKVE